MKHALLSAAAALLIALSSATIAASAEHGGGSGGGGGAVGSGAGVAPDHAERCLGHVIGGIRGIYDRYEYRDEKARAFEALAAQIGTAAIREPRRHHRGLPVAAPVGIRWLA